MANKVNKLYITLAADAPNTISAPTRVYAFTVTERVVGATAADDFGRFLQDRPALIAGAPAPIRAENAVSAWFQPGGFVTFSPYQVGIDFIAATGVATTAASINPILTRHFRVRASVINILTAGEVLRSTVNGTIYVQRQHSVEA